MPFPKRLCLTGAATALALPLLAQTAHADDPCFRRVFDFSELRAEPDRMVTEIALGPADPADAGSGLRIMLFEVWSRDHNARFIERAECRDGIPSVCFVEGEQGSFTTEPWEGGILLKPGEYGASLFSAEGVISLWADDGPDSEFVLYAVGPEMCPEPG